MGQRSSDAYRAKSPYPEGTGLMLFDFLDPGSQRCCGNGWSLPEGAANWCIGPESTLLFAPVEGECDQLLSIEVTPAWHPLVRPTQRLEVLVNGFPIASFTTQERHPRTLSCVVGADVVSNRLALVVTLRHPDTIRPCDIDGEGGGCDTRELSFLLSELRLQHLTPDYIERRDRLERSIDAPIASRARDDVTREVLDAALVTQFESFGENCEFGFVQRLAGAEPIGLLRFVGIPLHKLVRAVRSRFDGLALPGSLRLSPTHDDELVGREDSYQMLYHTPYHVRDGELDQLVIAEQSRLRFLARKLMEDLEDASKILVFKSDTPVALDDMIPLLDAVRDVGNNLLLWVKQAHGHHLPGTVDLTHPNLLIGYLDRVADLDVGPGTISTECWQSILLNASILRNRRDGAAAAPVP